jgi:membrane-bound lytic murein transglycosylase C
MLNNVYLSGIDNPTSRRYAVITAYNGGAGSVLRVFSSDKVQAANIINSMAPGMSIPPSPPVTRRRNRAAICIR